jgi:predicted Zn-dependent protease
VSAAATGRIEPDEALALAEAVLRLAEAEGATEAEALVAGGDEALTRFANSEIHQNVAESDVRINLRFVRGRRIGVASSGRTDPQALRELAATAGRIAAVAEEMSDWAGLPAAGPAEPVEGAFAAGTAEATPELRAAGVREVIAAADAAGVLAFGSFSTGVETLAIASSAGVRAAEARTSARLLVVTMGADDGTGYAEADSVDATALNAGAVGREAAGKARSSARPADIPAGDYPVVLEEYAVTDLLDSLGYVGFSGLAVQEERSFFEPGKRIGSALVTIVDDARDPAGMPAGFDYEGVPTRRVVMVERGVCREIVHDAATAARAGVASTGHGLPAPNPFGPFPLHAAMAAGTTPREELVRGLRRGLLVTRFHYTNVVHGKLAVITGMTRDGTFLVEDGEVVGPVRNLRFTQSYLDALAEVEAVSAERRLLRGELGAVLVPALRIGSWRFTGVTAAD